MKISRDWATPLTIGSFLLLAVTGILMFFHLDTGVNKLAHEWLSWVMVAGVLLHVLANLPAFKRHFTLHRGRWIIGACALVLGLSFLPLQTGGGKPPFMASVKALAGAPLPLLAQVGGISTDEARLRLTHLGIVSRSDTDTVAALVGPDLGAQAKVLGSVLKPSGVARP